MAKLKKITLLSALSILCACHYPKDNAIHQGKLMRAEYEIAMQQKIELTYFSGANPLADAKQALQFQDTRLWGYYERFAPYLPGVPKDGNNIKKLIERYGLRNPETMGDYILNDKHQSQREQFLEYAKHYNNYVLSHP